MENPDVQGEVEGDSRFMTLAIKRDLESTVRESWTDVESALQKHGLSGKLHHAKDCRGVERFCLTVSSTRDPEMNGRARAFTLFLAKTGFELDLALQVLNGELQHDFMRIGFQPGGLCSIYNIKREQFYKRLGYLGKHLEEISYILGIAVSVYDDTVGIIGRDLSYINMFRKVVKLCILGKANPASILKAFKSQDEQFKLTDKLQALHI